MPVSVGRMYTTAQLKGIRINISCTCGNILEEEKLIDFLYDMTDFLLTLARWPMASEHCRRTSDFLSYWPRLPSGTSTIAKNFEERKTELFS